ncbi:hypothetical protein PHYSODRAFT_341284 [Phytophthora sojae]|uniref:CCHC-type domain-containing protein n=1 Tax=Phytophthora sojae (strain P6497) TaxID=1094619 RepID=G5ACP9_PHYSP|nr:hypothetical protein PHYSODRAFT_341284 [Phytophthora sojae]EGZ07123.1 hypothetical protein PHYSODRAFT_341284 [Phytophthora sojae]|eukprot:XP_009537887.1 hypothetical protein PHYSODRAFT_341284 [Phytophthora sojae]
MVRVPGSTSPKGDVKVKGEVREDGTPLGPAEVKRENTRSTDGQAMGTPEPKDFVYEEKFPVKAPKGAARDSVQKPRSIGPAAKRDPGVAEKRGRNLEREHLKGVIRDLAARSDALDAAMDYMEVEDAKKKAEKKTEKLEISALAVHGPSNDTHDEDKRFREDEVNYFRQELAFLLQRDPLLRKLGLTMPWPLTGPVRNPRTLTIRDPLHAVTMLFSVLEDAGFKVHEHRISTDVRDYDLETTVLTLARVYAVLQKLVPSADESSAPLPTGDLTPPRLDDSRISFKFEDDGDALMGSTTSTKKPPPAPRVSRRERRAQGIPAIAQTMLDAGSLRKCQILRRLAQREDHVGGSRRLQQSPIAPAVWLKTFFTSLRTSETSLKTLRCNQSLRLPLGHVSGTIPRHNRNTKEISMTYPMTSAMMEDFSGKEHDEEAVRAWFNKVRTAFRRDQMQPDEMCLTFADLMIDPARNWYYQLSRTARASWTDLGEQFQIHFCGKGISLARKYYHMRRGSQEDPLDYLYRLNLAGIRANLKIHDGTKEQRREHVDHYIDTVQDDDLARSLVVLRLPDSEALEGVLLVMRRRHQRRKIETQGSKYRQKAPAPAASSRAVRVVTTGRGRRGDHEGLNEFEGESSSSDSESEDERAHVFLAARTPTQGDGEQPGGRQDREDQLGRPKHGTRCSHCGSRKHTDLGCRKRLTCQKCGRMGHPTDKCFYVCKCCGDVHEAGQCKIGDFFDAVRQWYNPTRHAGLLPESVEKALN